MELQTIIVSLLTALLGGGLSRLYTLRSIKREAKSKADQAEKNTEALTLKNTNEIVELYKKAMHDMQELNDKREAELQEMIRQQNDKIKEQSDKLEEFKKLQESQKTLIDKLTSTQGVFKLEIERLKKLAMDSCNSCEFKDSCLKYKAKQELDKTIRAMSNSSNNQLQNNSDEHI